MSCVEHFCKQVNRVWGDWADGFAPVEKDLEFKNASITYEKFCQSNYSERDWEQRKIQVLFIVANGIGLAALHLLSAVFAGIPTAYFDGGRFLKSRVFYVVRDLQQAWGGVALLFNNRYGSFHVYESQLEKESYDKYFVDRAEERANLRQFGALKISEMSPEEINKLFPISNGSEINCKLFGMIPKDEIHKALYKGTIDHRCLGFITPSLLEGLRISELPEETIVNLFFFSESLDRSSFACFETSEVHKALRAGRIDLFIMLQHMGLLSKEHLRDLDMTGWSEDELNRLYLQFSVIKDGQDFDQLNSDFVCKYLYAHAKFLSERSYDEVGFLTLLPPQHLRSLQISQLTTPMLHRIFMPHSGKIILSRPGGDWHEPLNTIRSRFANIQVAEVQAALEKGLLDKVLIALISPKQLEGIDRERLSKEVSAMLAENNYDALIDSLEEGEQSVKIIEFAPI